MICRGKTARALVGLGACAALAFPALAGAAPGGKHGSKAKGKAKPVVSYQLKGQVLSADASSNTLVMQVAKANRHGRSLVGSEVTVDVSAARLRIADVNGDGVRDLGDAVEDDRVDVQARGPKGSAPTSPVAASKVGVHHPEPEPEPEPEPAPEPAL